MKEPVGFDLEYQPPGPIRPACFRDATAVIVVSRRRPENGEAPKAVLTHQVGGSGIQSAPYQGLPESQLVPTTKRRVCRFIRADVIAVPPAHCTVPRVELVSHLGRGRDPDVVRQHRIQRAPQLPDVPFVRDAYTDRLTSRVHAGVGPARTQRRDRRGAEALERRLQNALNRALFRLPLPSTEPRPVVVQHELHGAFGHCWKATSTRGSVNQSGA